ncbi:MAG TPA: flagellar hook-length control protein FliK [Steroidobacteraceae bacterium]|nr:flagellar hook-length control protein FliK [Steroidobacteraceae bacterium]
MISTARLAATSAGAGAGANQPAAQASDAPAAPFDSVLALETLAAEANAAQLDLAAAACPEGGLEELQDELLGDDDRDTDEGDDVALGPLALLGMLVDVAAALTPAASAQSGDGAADTLDDALSGGGKPGADGAQLALPLGTSQADGSGSSADASAAAGLLAVAADGTGNRDSSTDATRPADALGRAAEWMTHGVRHAAATDHAPLATHVRDPRWAEEFGTRIALMVRGGESSASLQLTPVDLGPMEVSITVKDGQASVHFGAAQAETRQLIEASIPRLREMLAAQGFNLMDASVSQGFSRQARPDAPRVSQHASEPEAETRAATRVESTRLLDTYA